MEGSQHSLFLGAALPLPLHLPLPRYLGEALLEFFSTITTTPSCCRFSINLSSTPCWIKKEETSPSRTCEERGGTVASVLGSSAI